MPKQPKRAAGPVEHDDDTDEQSAEAVQTAKRGKSSPPARGAASKSRPSDDDELEDEDEDDEDDDEDDEEEVRPSARKPSASKRAVPVKAAKAAPRRGAPQLPPEHEIDAPKKQTLWMLGALALAICVMWGASRFACNAHPMQTRKPRDVSTAELARDPKGAALELAQRWASYDFAGALELASGSVAAEIQKAKQQCEADQAACDDKRKQLTDEVLATAVLLSREGERATARVSTDGGATGKEVYVLELAREGALWKAVTKRADTGAPPAPKPAPTAPAPAPAASP